MQEVLSLSSFAKVNVGLQVRNQRPDGYHTIHTVFQEISLHDTLTLKKQSHGWSFTSNVDWVPTDESNLCVKAFLVLQKAHPQIHGVSIHLEKSIPAGAGLGGGSSNAAAVLKGLNTLYNLSLEDKELKAIGVALGADVPFFFQGGTQIGDGVGEELAQSPRVIHGTYLVVVPSIHISTGWAYKEVKKHLENKTEHINFALCLRERNLSLKIFKNDFERIVIPAYPKIGKIKLQLLNAGASFAGLSGSGSAVYGIFDEETVARRAESVFPSHRTFIAHPTNQ